MSVLICKSRAPLSFIQDCENTLPDLSDLVPIHLEQVENFYGQVQIYVQS